jgi:hypothetical protein
MSEYINEKLKDLLDAFEEEERKKEEAKVRAAGCRTVHSIRVTRTVIRYRPGRVKHK